MTVCSLHTESNKQWLKITQFALFTSVLIALSVLSFAYGTVEIRRPLILLAASVFALFNFKKSSQCSLIQRIALLYIIEMLFAKLSQQFVHIGSFQISLALIILVPLSVAFVCNRLNKGKALTIETKDILKSWGAVFAIIVFHMLILFLLLKNFYGYGYEHSPNVLANMCLCFLVFLFSWRQLENLRLRQCVAAIITILVLAIAITQ